MKKKITAAAIFTAVLLLPTLIAIIAYISAQINPVTKKSIANILVEYPNGNKATILASDKDFSNFTDVFLDINSSGKSVSQLPLPESEYRCFKVTYLCHNKNNTYLYYMTSDVSNAYYQTSKGKYYKIPSDTVEKFLSTEFGIYVYPAATQPTLRIGDVRSVLPESMSWKFMGNDKQFYNGAVALNYENLEQVCNVSGGLELSFDKEPDYLYVILKNKNGETVFNNSFELLDGSYFIDNTVYEVNLEAKWYETEGCEWFGEGRYSFKVNVQSPAAFYLSSSTITYGDFVIVSARNVSDKSQISFSSVPEINFTPVFFEADGYYHALVPISLECAEINSNKNNYVFTLSYGGVTQDLSLNVEKASVKVGYPDITADKFNEYYNDATLKSFNETLSGAFSNISSELYWMSDGMLITPTEKNVKMGFGHRITISGIRESVTHYGVDFKVANNDTVSACLPGKVIFAGETKLSGKTVVIEHGGGLKSLYCNMNSVNVKVGDVLSKGKIIGIVGNTGLSEAVSLHFGLYVFDVPVRYYSYETNGVAIAAELRK